MDIRNMMKRILKEYDPRLRPNYLGKLTSSYYIFK